jgi:glycosyltransferase involved in cell wall biosynthesis
MLPPVSVVVIGLNEAEYLSDCFEAIVTSNYPRAELELIYVDSGSTDQSMGIARKYTSSVYIESKWPTAARNRNRGLIESKNDIVHFIDGDIVIDPDYLRFATEKLLEGNVHCVFGHLWEKNKKGIGRLLLHDYGNRKPGFIDAPGAGGTFLKRVLLDVNGWDERIPRGEETELGERLRKAGYKIWFLDKKMGAHNQDNISLVQFLDRQIKEGLSVGAISKINSDSRFFINAKKSLVNNVIFHFLAFLLLILSLYIQSAWLIILLLILYTGFLFCKYRIIRGITNPDSLKFYFLMNYSKIFVLYGSFKFRLCYIFLPSADKVAFKMRLDINSLVNPPE